MPHPGLQCEASGTTGLATGRGLRECVEASQYRMRRSGLQQGGGTSQRMLRIAIGDATS